MSGRLLPRGEEEAVLGAVKEYALWRFAACAGPGQELQVRDIWVNEIECDGTCLVLVDMRPLVPHIEEFYACLWDDGRVDVGWWDSAVGL